MQNVIATIPMSPAHEKKIGFYSIFAYLSRYAEQQNLGTVLGMNLVGKCCLIDTYESFRTSVSSLGLEPSMWWVDADLEREKVVERVQNLFQKGILIEVTREINTCSCGKVEYLSDVNKLRGSKTLIGQGNRALCCDSLITKQTTRVLVTQPLPKVKVTGAFPHWANVELQNILTKIAGKQLLVSRRTARNFSFETPQRKWNIDTDFLWWLYPEWLKLEGFHLQHLVVGSSILYQTAVMLAFSSLVSPDMHRIKVHCLPKVFFKPNTSISTLHDALTHHGIERVVNTLLWCALCKRKQIILHSSQMAVMSQKHCTEPLHLSRRKLHT